MMKNARDMYSKKTLNNENHTKTVWKFPQTQAATSLAKSKPATLVKHCCDDLEHRTIAPLHYIIAPHTLAPLYPLRRAIVPSTLRRYTPYIVPLYPLHCTIGLPTPYHCTLYIVPLHPLHGTIVPPISYHCTPYGVPLYIPPASYHHLSYHCTPYIVPVHPLYRTIAPSHRTIAPATSYHCTAYIAPLYLHHRTTALSSLHHRTCTSDPRTCVSYPLTIIAPTSRLPLRAVLLKIDNS